jgi:hypothetical protein
MNTKTVLTLLAALALTASSHAAPQAPDVLAQASKSGMNMAEPATISFEWIRAEEGSNAKEAAETLRKARFMVTTSTTKHSEPARTEFKMSAKWTGVLQETQMRLVIARLAELTAGQGSVNWQVTQVKR